MVKESTVVALAALAGAYLLFQPLLEVSKGVGALGTASGGLINTANRASVGLIKNDGILDRMTFKLFSR